MDLQVEGRHVSATCGGRALDEDAPLVVFVHGAGFDKTVWSLQTRWFANHGYSALAVDLPGHGGSDGPPLESIPALADWLAATIESLGFAEASIVGHSMGSYAALEFAARHSSVAHAIVLVGTAAEMPVHPDLLAAARSGDPLAFDLVTAWSFGRAAHVGGHRTPGLWMLGAGRRLVGRVTLDVLARDLTVCDGYRSALETASRVHCPTLVVSGDDDRMTPATSARHIAAAIDRAEAVTFPRTGHVLMVEQPDRFIDAVAGFLAAHG
ncbi:MAG TPA: alpha/beta hydrolase [Acidimicrobiia bacterium]|jgi:pimeloyl-ACP methyl ester carboxylesterase